MRKCNCCSFHEEYPILRAGLLHMYFQVLRRTDSYWCEMCLTQKVKTLRMATKFWLYLFSNVSALGTELKFPKHVSRKLN